MVNKKVLEDFQQATDQNLPVVNSFMLARFFAGPSFLAPEFRHIKTKRSARASYSDNAIGWVQVKREIPKPKDIVQVQLCHVRAEITPEHRVRSKNYFVHCLINEKKPEILKAFCESCVASADGCKHAVAFVCWLHRRSEDPSRTSVECYWRKSVLSKIGTSIKSLDIETYKPAKKAEMSGDVRNALFTASVDFCKSTDPSLLISNLSETESLSLFNILLKFIETPEPHSGEDFIHFCHTLMDDEQCKAQAAASIDQSKSELWYELRQGRITASKIYEVSRCSVPNGSLTKSILGAVKLKDTQQMERGRRLEPLVLDEVKKIYRGVKMTKTGLVLKRDFPVFGASPDALLGECIVEVKCPSTPETLENYFSQNRLEPANRYKGQMQLQMFMCDLKKGLFCVADPDFEKENSPGFKKVFITEHEFEPSFCSLLMSDAMNFWISNIYPRLYKSAQKS